VYALIWNFIVGDGAKMVFINGSICKALEDI